MAKPKLPAMIPTKKTKVAPNEMPAILILPRAVPNAMIQASTTVAWIGE